MYYRVWCEMASISHPRDSKLNSFLSSLVKTWTSLVPPKTENRQNLLGAPPEGFSWRAVRPVLQFNTVPLRAGRSMVLPCAAGFAVGLWSSGLPRIFALPESFWGDTEGYQGEAELSPFPLVPCQGMDEVWLLDPALDKSIFSKFRQGLVAPLPKQRGTVSLQILGQAFTKFSRVLFQNLKPMSI